MGKRVTREDESSVAHTENRLMKDTISAMREQLETMRFEQEKSGQRAIAAANAEILELRATVVALRDEMEKHAL